MKKVKNGNLNIHVHDSSTDEIAELINNFQDMCDELNQLIQENYQKELSIRESQLKEQINPHFLYNCLSLINSKALMTNQPEISKMSQLLSTFYRTTLNKGKSESTLNSEIQNIQSYIEIQQLLHDYCFEVIYQIDSHIPEILVPNLLLQPLVENSIIHGLLPKDSSHRTLFITITCLNDRIQFTEIDNGVGIPAEKLTTLTQTTTKGYGLKNVHDRLILKYGPEYGLTIKSIPDQSTMITFQIPLETS